MSHTYPAHHELESVAVVVVVVLYLAMLPGEPHAGVFMESRHGLSNRICPDCFGETRLVPRVPSSSRAGKRIYYYHYCHYFYNGVNMVQMLGDLPSPILEEPSQLGTAPTSPQTPHPRPSPGKSLEGKAARHLAQALHHSKHLLL